MTLLLPSGTEPNDLYYPIQAKLTTLVTTVVEDGSNLKLVILVSRIIIELKSFYVGYRQNCRYYFASQENGFITTDIWDFWAGIVFFPDVIQRLQNCNYSGPIINRRLHITFFRLLSSAK